MPFYGGMSPARRYGGGIPGSMSNAPQLQRVAESLAAQMGSAYDQSVLPPMSAVGMETHAYARALAFDGWGSNERLTNEYYPPTASIDGLLPRWERIMGTPPVIGDTQSTRQARVAAQWLQVATGNRTQEVTDALAAALGSLFVGLSYNDPSNAVVYVPDPTWPFGTVLAGAPWYSTIARLNVQLTIPTGYANPDGSPNAAWWQATGVVYQILDPMLPAWMTFQWYVNNPQDPSETGWILDTNELDLEVFDS